MTAPVDPRAIPSPRGADHEATSMRLQILITEHMSLSSSRTLAWTESFTRTGMFLSALSFGVVAIALVAQASGFDEGFRLFALAVLSVLLFLGIGTGLRLDSSSYHDLYCIAGMNRIRAMYLRLAPDLEPIFMTGATDDAAGIERTMALAPGQGTAASFISASPVQVAILNAALVATISGLIAVQLGTSAPIALVAGGMAFVLAMGVLAWYTRRLLRRVITGYRPLIPTPVPGEADAPALEDQQLA
jgi:hypothetical protein